jgi:hypothetical protein
MEDNKIFGIRREYIEIGIVLILLIASLQFMVGIATAVNASYALPPSNITAPAIAFIENTTVEPTPTPAPVVIRRIDQGGCVEPGETIDLAGIGWYTGYIAYYGRYRTMTTEGMNASLIYEIKPWQLRHYYIDPILYADYPGWWYSHYETVESGNSQLFKVNTTCTLPNITPERIATVVENKTILITGGIKIPPRYIQGINFILSRNTQTTKGADNNSYWWMFGNYDMKQYNIPVDKGALVTFSKNVVNGVPTGRYTIVFVSPGENNIIEETYDRNNESISSPFRNVVPIFIGSMTPETAEQTLIDRVGKSIDDSYSKIIVEIQDPMIEVHQLDQGITVDGKHIMTLAGYTNTNPGDIVTIEFDKATIDPELARENTWNTTVDSPYAPNAYRTWFKTVLFDPNDFSADIHTLTVTTGSGATASVPVPIRRELEENYKPPAYIQFIDNNPFVPTPTPMPAPPPVIVTVTQVVIETQIVVKEKIVPIDPYPYVIAGIVSVIVISYVGYTLIRAIVKERRKRRFDINKGDL